MDSYVSQTRAKIKQEKERNGKAFDRMMDRARTRDMQKRNRKVRQINNRTQTEETELNEVIKKSGDKWQIWSKDGSKKLGEYDSEFAAKKRLGQIEYFKHQTEEIVHDKCGTPDCCGQCDTADVVEEGIFNRSLIHRKNYNDALSKLEKRLKDKPNEHVGYAATIVARTYTNLSPRDLMVMYDHKYNGHNTEVGTKTYANYVKAMTPGQNMRESVMSFKKFLDEESGLNLNLKKMYDTFNGLYFNNELPKDLSVSWYKSKTLGGEVSVLVKKISKYKKEVVKVNHLKISNVMERSKKDLVAILLHEMVHVWVAVNNIHENMHGPAFEEKRKDIEKVSGISIPKTEAIGAIGLSDKLKQKTKDVIVVVYVNKKMQSYVQLYSDKSNIQDILTHFEKYRKVLEDKYLIVMIGKANTNLHHQRTVKRAFKATGVGGGQAITSEDFSNLKEYWKNNRNNLYLVISVK